MVLNCQCVPRIPNGKSLLHVLYNFAEGKSSNLAGMLPCYTGFEAMQSVVKNDKQIARDLYEVAK